MDRVDLSAFPIIRLDQITYLDDDTLNKSIVEIENMIQNNEHDNPQMYKYLVKQYESMKYEYTNRSAAARVSQLLNGLIDPSVKPEYYAIETPDSNVKKATRSISESVKKEPTPKMASLDNVDNNTSNRISSVPRTVLQPHPGFSPQTDSRHATHQTTNKDSKADSSRKSESSGNEVKSPSLADPVTVKFDTPAKVAPNINSVHLTPSHNTGIADPLFHDTQSSPRSTTSSKSNRSRRSQQLAAPVEEPSKKSLEVVYKNFGNSFIVAATEKKKRFYPAKKPQETPEEIKNKERAERRKQAMQRLLERQEERRKQQEKLKEQKRLEAAQRSAKKEKPTSEGQPDNTIIDSSDSESVSGGDEEFNGKIEVSESVLKAVQESIQIQQEIPPNKPDDDMLNDDDLPLPAPPVSSLTNEEIREDDKQSIEKHEPESPATIKVEENTSKPSLRSSLDNSKAEKVHVRTIQRKPKDSMNKKIPQVDQHTKKVAPPPPRAIAQKGGAVAKLTRGGKRKRENNNAPSNLPNQSIQEEEKAHQNKDNLSEKPTVVVVDQQNSPDGTPEAATVLTNSNQIEGDGANGGKNRNDPENITIPTNTIPCEPSTDLFEEKNFKALMTIRKLKEDKLNRSKSQMMTITPEKDQSLQPEGIELEEVVRVVSTADDDIEEMVVGDSIQVEENISADFPSRPASSISSISAKTARKSSFSTNSNVDHSNLQGSTTSQSTRQSVAEPSKASTSSEEPIQSKLWEVVNSQLVFKYCPENLPGLRALKLVSQLYQFPILIFYFKLFYLISRI